MNNKESLETLGYCVMRLPDALFEDFSIATFLCEQIEFIDPTTTSTKVMGGFGALGNPSSFHHRDLRRFRTAVYEYMFRQLFCDAFPGQYLQCIADRFSVRRTGTSTSAESWHQDVSVPHGTGLCFGGWVNLDSPGTADAQVLSCVPATHTALLVSSEATGFAKIAKDDVAGGKKKRIEIPPRHCIVFNELLVHEVLVKKQTQDTYRLYMKYLVTPDKVMPFGTQILDRMRDHGVPPYNVKVVVEKGGGGGGKKRKRHDGGDKLLFEYPKMYSNNHVTNNNKATTKECNKIEHFSATLAAPFRAVVREGLMNAGKEWVYQTLPSLKQVGLTSPLVPEYSSEELSWYTPKLIKY